MPSIIVVPDTNVLLHSHPLDRIPWCDVVDASTVEVVLVAQVLRELDAKKNGESEKLRKRARGVLSKINDWLPSVSSLPCIREGVTLRARIAEPREVDGLDMKVADDRILASAVELRDQLPVVIVTGDTTMRLKADALGFQVVAVPDTFCIRDDEKPKQVVAPRALLRAALFDSEGHDLSGRMSTRVGLSAAHLLGDAEQMLRAAHASVQSAVRGVYGRERRLLTSLDEDLEPTAESWEYYVKQLRDYDRQYEHTVEVTIGVLNEGTAPADDVLVEFQFPPNVYVHDSRPRLPARPRRRSRMDDLTSLARSALLPTEVNERFWLHSDGETGALAQVKIRRLLQSRMTAYTVWAEVEDDDLGGFSIEARVLAASPPLTIDGTLNIRFER